MMLDPSNPDWGICKDCRSSFPLEALADEQCFECWVVEEEAMIKNLERKGQK